MAEHGGYRKPANPAPVSGPGKFSKRTDGQVTSTMPSQDYGQARQDHAVQSLQPMAAGPQAPAPAPIPAGQPQQPNSAPAYGGPEFGAPSNRPGEPVTAGAPAGAGPGPEVLGGAPDGPMMMPTGQITNTIKQLAAADNTGLLANLYLMAQQRGV